ncbi:MAG: thioesterase [Sulfurimonas sp.]|nr:MAG: thioesterase [Sulfurimonas sp.]
MTDDYKIDDEELKLHEYREEEQIIIHTHQKINHDLCGEIEKVDIGYVELKLVTLPDMVADDMGLIHGGFIFSAADYAAMVAINEKNVVLVACDAQFLSPAKFGDVIYFKAKVRHKEGRKRNVNVTAFVGEIKIFEAEFKTVVTDRHVLKLHLLEEEEENISSVNPDL